MDNIIKIDFPIVLLYRYFSLVFFFFFFFCYWNRFHFIITNSISIWSFYFSRVIPFSRFLFFLFLHHEFSEIIWFEYTRIDIATN